MVFSTYSHGAFAFFVPVCIQMRVEDTGIMGAGHETMYQRVPWILMGKTWASGYERGVF